MKKREHKGWLADKMDLVFYLIFRIMEGVLRCLPLPLLWHLGSFSGFVFGQLARGYRKLAFRNLQIAFGQTTSTRERKRLLNEHFSRLGGNLLCSLKLPGLAPESLAQRVEVEGAQHLSIARQPSQSGDILCIAHMSSWEILAQSAPLLPVKTTIGAIYQPMANRYLESYIKKSRSKAGCAMFNRREGLMAPLKHLKEGGTLGLLMDQHAGKRGIWCPLFGKLASTSPLASLFAAKSGARLIPAAVVTTGPARWKIIISPPIAPSPNASTPSVTAEINRRLEQLIELSPSDWFWVHDRWKTPLPHYLFGTYRRGWCLPDGMTVAELQPFHVIIRSPNWLGDACMAVPAVRAIKLGRPDIKVTLITPDKLQDIWKAVPEVDHLVIRQGRAGARALGRAIRDTGLAYDAGVLLPNSIRSALEMWWGGIPRISGYRGHWRSWFLHHIVGEGSKQNRKPRPPRHHVDRYLHIAQKLGANITLPWIRVSGVPAKTPGPIRVGIVPGAEYGSAKRWPLESFGDAINRTVAKGHDIEWLFFGVAKEAPMGETLAGMTNGTCRNLMGKTSLTELIQTLRTCRVLLTNDTGTMHLAGLLGVPVVALFGSTEPALTSPMGENNTILRKHVECSPCFLRECPIDFRCMKEITPEMAANALERYLK
jgi:heptosyltransferase II